MNSKRLRRHSSVCSVLACSVVLLASCSTHFKEKYYVGVFEQDKGAPGGGAGPTQFYRFRLDGWASLFSKTRYEAGWYDASVVDRLFGEIRPKTSPPMDEWPDASKAPIDVIPLLYAKGVVKKDDDAAAKVKGYNVNVDLRGKKATVPLSNLTKIHADSLNITVEKKDGTTTVVKAEVAGVIEVTYWSDEESDKTPDNLKKELSVDVTATGPDSWVECKNLAALDLAGGVIDVTTDKLESKGETWAGVNQFAFTRSPYHNFEWQGGKFQILNGNVRPNFHGLEAGGSIAHFTSIEESTDKPKDNLKINITARAGWLLRLASPGSGAGSTLKGVSVKRALPGKDQTAFVQGIAYDKFKVEEREPREAFKSKVDKLENNGKETFSLSNVTFSLGSKTEVMNITDGDEKTVEVEIDQYRAQSFEVASGLFQLSTTRAVERALKEGKTVVYQDPNRQIFLHFGPEGVGSAQRKDERFVIFMTANPRVLVNRIRALVNSERTQSVIATALITPRLVKEKKKIQDAQLDTSLAKKLAGEAMKFVDGGGLDTASPAELNGKVTDWLGQLGSGPLGMLSLLQGADPKNKESGNE